jgi:hypothetical protein
VFAAEKINFFLPVLLNLPYEIGSFIAMLNPPWF